MNLDPLSHFSPTPEPGSPSPAYVSQKVTTLDRQQSEELRSLRAANIETNKRLTALEAERTAIVIPLSELYQTLSECVDTCQRVLRLIRVSIEPTKKDDEHANKLP